MPAIRSLSAQMALGFTTLVFACVGSSSRQCTNDLIARIPSPDARYDAVVFQRDCGATTGFSTQVSILRSRDSLPSDSSGNVFVADTDHGKAPAGPGGGPSVDVRWTSPDSLEIRRDPRTRVFRTLDRLGSVHVTHVPRLPSGGA